MEPTETTPTVPPSIPEATKPKLNQLAVISFGLAVFPFVLRLVRMRSGTTASTTATEAAVYTIATISLAFLAIVVGVIALALRRHADSRGRGWGVAGILIGATELVMITSACWAMTLANK
jgi:hypothetical protein